MVNTPLPLALTAKEPDLGSGLRYAAGSLLLCGPLWLLAPLAFQRTPRARRWLPAFAAHTLCITLAGGDWMPLYRLWVPVLPWLIAVTLGELRMSRLVLAALFGATASSACCLIRTAPRRARWSPGASRWSQSFGHFCWRRAPWRPSTSVGVGRATSAEVIDLGGVTDPRVAALPGGHTSKSISPGFFAAREVDTWIVRAADKAFAVGAPLETLHCAYAVDARLTRRASDLGFSGIATIDLPGTGEQYVVARHDAARH